MPSDEIKNPTFAWFLVTVFSLAMMTAVAHAPIGAVTVTDLVFPLAFGAWIFAVGRKRLVPRWHYALTACVFYFLALFISAVSSIDPALGIKRLAVELYLILLAFTAYNFVTSAERLRVVCLAWIIGAVIPIGAALIAITLFYTGAAPALLEQLSYHYGAVPVGNYPRVRSTFVTPSMFCNYLTVTLLLVLGAARMGWIKTRLAILLSAATAIAALSTASIALGGLFLAAGGWLATTPGMSKPLRRLAFLSGAIPASAFLLIAPFALATYSPAPFSLELPLVGPVDPSSRLLVWIDAGQTFFANPLTGKGLGTNPADVTYQNLDGTRSLLTDAHNTFLNVAAQAGVVGLAAFVTVLVIILRTAVAGNTPIHKALAIAFVCSFVYDGLTGSFENARHLWVLIGLILAAYRIEATSR